MRRPAHSLAASRAWQLTPSLALAPAGLSVKAWMPSAGLYCDESTDTGSTALVSSEECLPAPKTTLMVRNLPKDLTRDMLMDLLNRSGFWKRYDFLYAPIDHSTYTPFGYAFVNFITPQDALEFRDAFQGFERWGVPADGPCEIVWSEAHQGLQDHVERLRNGTVMHESVPEMYKPLLFHDGVVVPFPPPTKRIRAPRSRKVDQLTRSEVADDAV